MIWYTCHSWRPSSTVPSINHQVARTELSKRESLNGRTSPVSPLISTRTMKRCCNNTDIYIYDIPQRSPSVVVVVVVVVIALVALEPKRRRKKLSMYPYTTDNYDQSLPSYLLYVPHPRLAFSLSTWTRTTPVRIVCRRRRRASRTHAHAHAHARWNTFRA